MNAEQTLNATLLGSTDVTAIVGSGAGARIYPDIAPQEVSLPCVAFTRVGTEAIGTFSSAVVATKATLEVWCMASSRAAAETLADTVVSAAAAAWFVPSARRSEYDDQAALWASALILDFWEQ